MQVRLPFGRDTLEVEVPDANLRGVLTHRPAPPLHEPEIALRQALVSPIGSLPLREIVRGKQEACVVICDITRPVPNHVTLPPLLEALNDAGIHRDRVTILIATGTHRPNVGDELIELVGPEIARNYRIENHSCTDSPCVDLGLSPRGTPIRLNRAYIEADLKITAGMIEPHFMAGYAGGRKMIMPGVAALDTIQFWHSPRFLEHPNATNGILEGNPVHEEALAIARLARADFILDVTIDSQRRINGIFAGDMEAAWERGVAFSRAQTTALLEEPVDIVLTTSGGYPLDLTFYQVIKGMIGALPICKPGGTIILVAACDEGVGKPIFQETLMAWSDLEEFMAAVQRDDWQFISDQWQVEELARAVRHHEVIHVCRGIDTEILARIHVTPEPTVESALERAFAKHGPGASLAVIPAGPYVTACLSSAWPSRLTPPDADVPRE